ncbi:MAG: nucleotidyltransferase [Caldiserica bacterium]|nr:nucleotidyltransferase [Caldisericota bacterium]
MVPNTRFTELLNDIEPSATTKSNCSYAHSSVREFLRTHSSFKNRWKADFLTGSYARSTAIRPKKTGDDIERPDVDIIVVTNFSQNDHPDDVLEELSTAIKDGYTVERINKRSVRVVTSYAEIDLVPTIDSVSAYLIPDRDLGHWKWTNPPAHTDWSRDQNDAFNGRFKPLVKLFKWWRRENQSSKRPKGFVLEVLVSKHAPLNESHFGEAIAKMLESIYASYGFLAERNIKPTIDDPGLPGNDILSKVSLTDWKSFIEKVRVHASYARQAQNEEDLEEATRLWRKLFGDRFKPTSNPAKATSLSSFASAPTVLATGYKFPDKPASPTKPRGFA